MTTRRTLLAGLGATVLAPGLSWASAGAPDFLSAARKPDGTYALAGLRESGEIAFAIPLPGRGHAAAAHPKRPVAVAFARRPGRFAVALDCVTGATLARFEAPQGRHFYGHGAFSADGRSFFTTENDFEAARGVIGVWNAADFTRTGEFSSGGIGPHDIALMPDGESLVVANGGIETHPDAGRAKLNIPTMRPNLSYLGLDGAMREVLELEAALHRNSIRHLALRPDGLVAFAMQWQGDLAEAPPLLGLHRRGESLRLLSADPGAQRRMQGYAGSVSISASGAQVAISSPRGGATDVFDPETGRHIARCEARDVCGLGPESDGFFFSTGTGDVGRIAGGEAFTTARAAMNWDNHLIAIPKPG